MLRYIFLFVVIVKINYCFGQFLWPKEFKEIYLQTLTGDELKEKIDTHVKLFDDQVINRDTVNYYRFATDKCSICNFDSKSYFEFYEDDSIYILFYNVESGPHSSYAILINKFGDVISTIQTNSYISVELWKSDEDKFFIVMKNFYGNSNLKKNSIISFDRKNIKISALSFVCEGNVSLSVDNERLIVETSIIEKSDKDLEFKLEASFYSDTKHLKNQTSIINYKNGEFVLKENIIWHDSPIINIVNSINIDKEIILNY